MRKTLLLVLSGLLALQAADAATSSTCADKHVFGLLENMALWPENIQFEAKLDTGALTSSLDAKNIELFQRDGAKWVKFDVEGNRAGDTVSSHFERKVERTIRVRGAGGDDVRPAVTMRICLGDKVYSEQFTLRDRGNMKFPVLIGERTLGHLGVVDVTQEHTLELACKGK